jgi:hypothetical protein
VIVHTRFSIGDFVVGVRRTTEQVTKVCARCGGKGELELKEGGTLPCPNRYNGRESCNSGKVTLGILSLWAVSSDTAGHVGQVRVTRTAHRYASPWYAADVNEYMLTSTGVGSGSIWKEDDLFASHEGAEAECNRRNADPKFTEERENILAGFRRQDAEASIPEVEEVDTAPAGRGPSDG